MLHLVVGQRVVKEFHGGVPAGDPRQAVAASVTVGLVHPPLSAVRHCRGYRAVATAAAAAAAINFHAASCCWHSLNGVQASTHSRQKVSCHADPTEIENVASATHCSSNTCAMQTLQKERRVPPPIAVKILGSCRPYRKNGGSLDPLPPKT